MKVLVVDDNKEGRLLLSKLLTSNNYEVIEACNGIEALEYLKASKPDIIISDILMPEMDGFTLLRELNKDISGGKIPIVLYSAHYVNEKDKKLAEKLGASRFITKPAEPKDILKEIKTVIAEFESSGYKHIKPVHPTNEDYLDEYAQRVFKKLEDKVRELEQEITERKKVETKLEESIESYRSLFNNSPISLWEEDFSEVKKHIDGLRNKGIKDFRIYFQKHPEEVVNCANMSKVIDVNRATLQLFEAGNKGELLAGLGKVFGEESFIVFREALIALIQDKVLFESETINYTLSGKKIHIILKWSVAPGYEMNLSKVLVSILDITQRKIAEESLKLSEEKYRDLFENANDAICIVSEDLIFKDINTKTLKLTGYSKEELLKMSIYDVIPPEQVPRSNEEFKKLRERGKYEKFIGKILTKSGNLIDVEVNSSAIIEDGRIIGSRDILRDITERKRAEEKMEASLKEKEILLREIHHRVKNNMQIISSMLGLASGTIKDKKFVDLFRESQNRIYSMSLIHEKLYRSRDLAKIDLKEYIRDLAKAIFQSRGVKTGTIVLKLNIGNVYLGIDHSIPLGLIINELITNSLKYAFPGDRKGEILVFLHLIDEKTFELIVSDNGVGIPDDVDFRNTDSLGLRLVTILVENQLKGKIDLDRSKGTEFNIKFKGMK